MTKEWEVFWTVYTITIGIYILFLYIRTFWIGK